MKMTPEAFHTWCQHLGLTSETEALLASIRSSPPIRRVKSRAGNITGRFPSPKMGVSIQFESAHVEFWAIYAMERDPDVLEYYDQPCRIPLTYQAKSGKRTTQWHTLTSLYYEAPRLAGKSGNQLRPLSLWPLLNLLGTRLPEQDTGTALLERHTQRI